MAKLKVITVNQSVFAENDAIAAETREALRKKGLLFLNVMASPGAGKTTLLLATIRALKDECRIGVMEADIEATVDAKKSRPRVHEPSRFIPAARARWMRR